MLELALKAVICKTLDVMNYPTSEKGTKDLFKTHEVDTLVLLAGLRGKLTSHRAANGSFDINWNLLVRWKPDFRYTSSQTSSGALDMLDALRSTDRVLSWLSQQW